MAFSKLNSEEKDAFFTLLDEYFTSRPEIFAREGEGGLSDSAAVVARKPSVFAASEFVEPTSVGRVAAAAAALRLNSATIAQGISSSPRPPPRRTVEDESEYSEQSERSTAKLVQQKKFGDVDMSSGTNMFRSLRNSTASKSAVPSPIIPVVPSAFTAKKNSFTPPPVRRAASATSSNSNADTHEHSVLRSPPLPARQATVAVESEGEWVHALYSYSSEDPNDLQLQEGETILVLEKPSDDWWKGERDGEQGLFPASYVRAV